MAARADIVTVNLGRGYPKGYDLRKLTDTSLVLAAGNDSVEINSDRSTTFCGQFLANCFTVAAAGVTGAPTTYTNYSGVAVDLASYAFGVELAPGKGLSPVRFI